MIFLFIIYNSFNKIMYKVGDKVKIIGDSCCHREEIGTIIEIVRIYDGKEISIFNRSKYLYLYKGGKNGNENGWGNYVLEEDIEKLLTDPIESLFNHFKGLGKPDDVYKLNK